jgi:hypothetical protein
MVRNIENRDLLNHLQYNNNKFINGGGSYKNRDKKGGKTFFKPYQSDKFDNVVNTFSKRLDSLLYQSSKDNKNQYQLKKDEFKQRFELQKKDFASEYKNGIEAIDEERRKHDLYVSNLKKQKGTIINYIRKAYNENPLAAKIVIVKQLEEGSKRYNAYELSNLEKIDLDTFIKKEYNVEKAKLLTAFDFAKIDAALSNSIDNVYSKVEKLTKESISRFMDTYSKYLRNESLQFIQKSLDQSSVSKNFIANIIFTQIKLTEKIANGEYEKKEQKARREKILGTKTNKK